MDADSHLSHRSARSRTVAPEINDRSATQWLRRTA